MSKIIHLLTYGGRFLAEYRPILFGSFFLGSCPSKANLANIFLCYGFIFINALAKAYAQHSDWPCKPPPTTLNSRSY